MPLTMTKQTAASVTTPAAGKVSVFVDTVTGEPYYKDSTGTSTSLKGTGGAGGAGGRPYTNPAFSSVSSLLHGDGTNGSTTIIDQVAGNTWTASSATISTTQSFLGGASIKFTGGSNSSISCPTNSKFNLAAGDWALEFRIYPAGTHETSARIFQTRNGDVYGGISLTFSSGNTFALQMSSNGSSYDILNGSGCGSFTAGAWNSCVIQRVGDTVEVFVNQVSTYSSALPSGASIYYNAADSVILGGNSSGTSRSINAFMDEIRLTKGASVIGPIVTLPVTAFPDS